MKQSASWDRFIGLPVTCYSTRSSHAKVVHITMKFLIFSLAAVIAAARTVCAEDEYPTRIPDAIAACYEDKAVSNRYNRLPHSLDNLIAIIRKIEAHPDTEFWSLAKMTGTILRRFRHDGIIDNPITGPGLVPIKRDSVESDKYSLLWEVIPGHANDFPENALSFKEKCSLHWMLSYSINSTQRLEEKPRQNARMAEETTEEDETSGAGQEHHVVDHETPEEMPETPQDNDIGFEKHEMEPEEDDHFQGHDEAESSDDHETDVHDEDDRRKRDVQTQSSVPQSARPLQLGVVQTPWGTVAAGVVLAGIAAGREPQTAKLKNLIKDPTLQISETSMERNVHSLWAATLSGELAQTALLRSSMGQPSVGPRGDWNCSICIRENILPIADISKMTNSELYAGIDGLLIGQRIEKWDSDKYPTKLSQILEMYYSNGGVYEDTQYRACNRLNLFNSMVDKNVLKEQALSAALIYYAKGMEGSPSLSTTVRPVDAIGTFVNTSYNEMTRFLESNVDIEKDFVQCQGAPEAPSTETPATYTDLTVVVDQFTDFAIINQQKEMIAKLALLMNIQPGGSRMEVVSGKDGTPFINLGNTTNKGELACKIMDLDIKFSERRLADALGRLRSTIAQERVTERSNKVTGANSRTVVIFVAGWTAASAEKDKMKTEYQKMLQEMPDVNLMFVTVVSGEEFRPFVKRFDRDVIKMQSFADFKEAKTIADRLVLVPARLLYPACKEAVHTGETSFTYSSFINANTIQYYRLGAEHFFSSQSMKVQFKSLYGVNRICSSRTNDRPSQKDSCKNALRTNETIEFAFNQPCARLPNAADCQPIFFSVAPIGGDDNIPCSEKNCHSPDQVKFTFVHEGLRCQRSGATSNSVISNVSLLAVLLLTWTISRIA